MTTLKQIGVRTGTAEKSEDGHSLPMSKPFPAEPYEQWKAESHLLWRLIVLVALLAIAGCYLLWLQARRETDFFSFESYEGNGSAPRIEDAKFALEKIVPHGSELAKYDSFFQKVGGGCALVADTTRYPHTAVCWYDHGFVISAGWRYVIDFDPSMKRSTHTELNFGLTGL